jgi:hypothetical protein
VPGFLFLRLWRSKIATTRFSRPCFYWSCANAGLDFLATPHRKKWRQPMLGRAFEIATAAARHAVASITGLPSPDEQKKTRLHSYLSA